MFWAILGITFIFTLLLAFFIKTVDVLGTKADWSKRRCGIDVIFTAFLYKPADDPRSSFEFTQDNFLFCTGQVVESVLKSAFSPFMDVASGSMGSLGVIGDSLNSIKKIISNLTASFSKIIDVTYNRFKEVLYGFIGNWHRMTFLLQRAMTIALAAVYSGISFVAGFLNLYDYVVKVVIIILSILLALIFFLFFALIPVMPVIFTVISVLVGAGFAGAVGGMASGFCIDPDASVLFADGSTRPLKDCKLGDVLKGRCDGSANIITGILDCDASTDDCVLIDGVHLSKSHRVLWEGQYILAENHPRATAAPRLPRLICLNTITHEVPIMGSKEILWAGDWEEVDDDEGRTAWLESVYQILNNSIVTSLFTSKPTTVPLLSPLTIVHDSVLGYIPLKDVKTGSLILDRNGKYTKIIALYSGFINANCDEPYWLSDGVWVKSYNGSEWIPAIYGSIKESAGSRPLYGLNVITESGSYMIRFQGHNMLIRDFTEMGINAVKCSYEMLDKYVKKL
jgi:hypothetical protein